MAFDFSTLVTDRTLEDVANKTAKGFYNATDLNRVDACLEDLVARLNRVGCLVPGYVRVKIERETKPASRLPEGYTEVQYIQSTGTQYVDTGVKVNKADAYKLVLTAHLTSNDNYAGCNGYMQFQAKIGNGQKSKITVEYANVTETISVNDAQISSTNWASYDGQNVKLGLLKMGDTNNSWFSGSPQVGKIYSSQVYSKNAHIRDYVPCISPTGAVGLYDLVDGKFYGNAGTGSFTAGPVVERPKDPNEGLDPYTWYERDTPTFLQLSQYRANVDAVRSALQLPDGTPVTPDSMRRLTTAGANSIEAVLLAVDLILNNIPAAVRHCGVTVCGSKGVRA